MTAVSIDSATQGAVFAVQNSDLTGGSLGAPDDLKFGLIELADTVDAADTVDINMKNEFGMNKLLGIMSWKHTTNESVVVTEANTCTVNNGIVTVTIVAGTDDDKRIIMLVGV